MILKTLHTITLYEEQTKIKDVIHWTSIDSDGNHSVSTRTFY